MTTYQYEQTGLTNWRVTMEGLAISGPRVVDLCFSYTVEPRQTPWFEFEYNGKPRLACVLRSAPERGGLQCMTPDGFRTFKPAKMIDIRDVTTLGD